MSKQHHRFDKSSKWLIQHHGDSMLRMAGVNQFRAWRPRQAEVVQPRQLPDGLLEVEFDDETEADPFLLEIATYPERRVLEQLTRDMMLVYLDQGVLPEAITIVLCRKGRYQIPSENDISSRLGLAGCAVRWRTVQLWDLLAEDLFATGDVGLIPWIPLTSFPGSPEPVFNRCRETIENNAAPGEVDNLFAVTQVLSILKYDDPNLLELIGGRRVMIESPLIQEIVAEAVAKRQQDDILAFLNARFGDVPQAMIDQIKSITDSQKLTDLINSAASCDGLERFGTALAG